MIDYNPKAWYSLITHAYSRHVMRTLRPVLIFMSIYTGVICFFVLDFFELNEKQLHSTMGMHSLLGVVLGLFLVFRTNSAYDRWWEGRKLWGSLVNNTRNLAHKLNAFLPRSDSENRDYFSKMIPNFVISVKESLRGAVNINDFEKAGSDFTKRLENIRHIPNRLSSMMYERVNELYKKNEITGDQLFLVDKELKEFSDILGACERIKNTPIPYSYSMYIKKFIFIYIITLPFGFVTLIEYLTIPVVVITSFVIFSVELLSSTIAYRFLQNVKFSDVTVMFLC